MHPFVICLGPFVDIARQMVDRPDDLWTIVSGNVKAFEYNSRCDWCEFTNSFEVIVRQLMVVYARVPCIF